MQNKIRNIKNIIVITLFFIMGTSVFAQEKGSYLSIGGGAGLSSFQYKITNGKAKPGLGFHGNINYSYFFSSHWGVGTGIQISRYRTNPRLTEHTIVFEDQIDEVGDVHRRDIYLHKWEEKQTAVFLEIPLLLQYQYKFAPKRQNGLYANMGAKVQFAQTARYNVVSSLETEGYYDQWHVLLYGLPQHGFGPDNPGPEGDLSLKTSFALTAEFGFLFGLKPNVDLYLGAYCDYGLITLNKTNPETDVIYLDHANRDMYQSILTSKSAGDANAVSVGGKVGLRIKLGKTKKEPLQEVPVVIPCDTVWLHDTIYVYDTVYMYVEQDIEQDVQVVQVDSIIYEPIFFALDSYKLTAESKYDLDKKVNYLKKNENIILLIRGNTCDLGNERINGPLGLNRAKAAKYYLVQNGIAEDRIRVISESTHNPMRPNTSEENRAFNRRCDFDIEDK